MAHLRRCLNWTSGVEMVNASVRLGSAPLDGTRCSTALKKKKERREINKKYNTTIVNKGNISCDSLPPVDQVTWIEYRVDPFELHRIYLR